MTAPIAIELIANPTPDAAEVRALLDACSNAAGPGGCVLGAPDGAAQATAIVRFSPGLDAVRVEVVPGASREVAFRADDPVTERFRAAGLVAAGLVVAASGPPPVLPESAAPSANATRIPVALVHLGGGVGYGSERAWWEGAIGADFALGSPLFLSVGGLVAHTASRDASGIVQQRAALAAGLGVAAPLVRDRLELRARAEVEVTELHAAIVQPGTGREGEGDRTLVGAGGEIELVFPVAERFGFFVRDRFDVWGSDTALRVDGRSVETLGAWQDSAIVGLNVRLP